MRSSARQRDTAPQGRLSETVQYRLRMPADTQQLRTIHPDEMEAWVATFHVPFLDTQPAAPEAEFRRSRVDFDRTWAAFDADAMVGTLRTFATQLTTPGCRAIDVDAVTNVSVTPTHRRQGHMRRMVENALRKAAERGEVASILIAAEFPIYGRFGYGLATEHVTYALDAQRARFNLAHDGGTVELATPQVARREAEAVFERWRTQTPGAIRRSEYRWDVDFGLIEAPNRKQWKGFCGLYRDDGGEVQGYMQYHPESNWDQRLPKNTIVIDEMVATTPAAYTALWRFCAELDLVATVSAEDRPVDEPLYWQLVDGRALRQQWRADFLWLRLLDVAAALANRTYTCDGAAVVEVSDPLGFANGRFALEGGPGGATCRRTTETADLTVSVAALSAAYLGGPSLTLLQQSGQIDEQRPGAVAKFDAMLATRPAPFCNTWF